MMKSMKSLLIAGTVAAGLGVSAFSLPTYAAGTTINTGNIASYSTGEGAYTLTAGEYELGSDLSLGTDTITIDGAVTLNFGNYKITTANVMVPAGASLTLSGSGGVIGSVTSSGTLTINGGVYDASAGYGGALNINGGTLNVSGGEFKAGGASAAYFAGDVTATISNGSFTSTGDNGIEANGNVNMTISGGTFSGPASGINLSNSSTMKLSGGTFSCTGTGDNAFGAIAIFDGATSAFNGFLASGYEYDNSAADVMTWYGMSIARLTGTTVKVRAIGSTTTQTTTNTPSENKQKALEEMGKEMEKVIAKGTSTDKTAKKATTTKKVKAPNTSVAEGAVAAEGMTVLTMATLAGGAILIKKRI